jgi:hypothetical protein
MDVSEILGVIVDDAVAAQQPADSPLHAVETVPEAPAVDSTVVSFKGGVVTGAGSHGGGDLRRPGGEECCRQCVSPS